MRTRITPNTDTFCAESTMGLFLKNSQENRRPLNTPLKWYKGRFYNVATNQNIVFLGIKKVPWILNSLVTPFVVMMDNYKFTLGNLEISVENTIQVNE